MLSFSSSFDVIFNQPRSRTTFISIFVVLCPFVNFFKYIVKTCYLLSYFGDRLKCSFHSKCHFRFNFKFIMFVEEYQRLCVGKVRETLVKVFTRPLINLDLTYGVIVRSVTERTGFSTTIRKITYWYPLMRLTPLWRVL